MNDMSMKIPVRSELRQRMVENGYSFRQISQAYRLLHAVGFDPEAAGWDDRQRFHLFDCLSGIAFNKAFALKEAEGADTSDDEACLMIAQCAMEMVSGEAGFSQEILDEVGAEEVADSLAAAE